MPNKPESVFEGLNDLFCKGNLAPRFRELTLSLEGEVGRNLFERSGHPYHFTASAFIVDADMRQTLLVFHKKLRIWIQPGGHADGITDLAQVAYKEAEEETGLKSLRLMSREIFDFDVTPIPAYRNDPAHSHLDVRYLFEADPKEVVCESAETEGARWFSLSAGVEELSDLGVQRMMKMARIRR